MTVARIHLGVPGDQHLDSLSDADFLGSMVWSSKSPRSLKSAAAKGDRAEFLRNLRQEHLRPLARALRKQAGKQFATRRSLWSADSITPDSRTRELLDLWQGEAAAAGTSLSGAGQDGARNRLPGADVSGSNGAEHRDAAVIHQPGNLELWLETATGLEPVSAVELLILLDVLLTNGARLDDATLWKLWRFTLTTAVRWIADLDAPLGPDLTIDQRLLITGELPLMMAIGFAPLKGSGKVGKFAAKSIRTQLVDATDGDGAFEASRLPRFPWWLASLVRSEGWSQAVGEDLWTKSTRERFSSLLRFASSMCRADGAANLGNGCPHPLWPMLTVAAALLGWKKKSGPGRYISALNRSLTRPEGKAAKKSRSKKRKTTIDWAEDDSPGVQSDWARVACLRNDWSIRADSLVVTHHGPVPTIELSPLGHCLASGPWTLDIAIDGEPVSLDQEWMCACWHSDDEVDYLELHMSIGDRLTVERQILLSRDDHLLVLADAVSGAGESRIDLTSRIPLISGAQVVSDVPTRECQIGTADLQVRVYPLCLPDDRVQSAAGEFGPSEDGLALKLNGHGGVVAPVVFDWHPERVACPADWRALSIAENNVRLSAADAGGYRLRVGDQQWVFFRSLTRATMPRTMLGHQTTNETVIGRFNDDGEVEPMLLVE